MKNVNFWKETATLYINGVPCAVRKATLLTRGFKENVEKFYEIPITEETRFVLTRLFGLVYSKTIFTRKLYYEPDWLVNYTTENWKLVTCNTGKLFEKDIDTIRVKLEYTPYNEVSMKKLFEYPAELVTEFLVERGITACPMKLD